jgi:hypothetical protein
MVSSCPTIVAASSQPFDVKTNEALASAFTSITKKKGLVPRTFQPRYLSFCALGIAKIGLQ